ncbi:unnamed protein product [Mortierella alpina]
MTVMKVIGEGGTRQIIQMDTGEGEEEKEAEAEAGGTGTTNSAIRQHHHPAHLLQHPTRQPPTNAAAPTTLPAPQYILPGHTEATAESRKQSIGLIAGIAGGAFLLIVLSSFLWWCVSKRRRRQQVVSHSETNLNSPSNGTRTVDSALTSRQQSDLESFQLHFVPEKTAFAGDQPPSQSESPRPRVFEEGQFPDFRLNSSSTPDLKSTHHSSVSTLPTPTQLPVIPLPTRRDQRTTNNGNIDSLQKLADMPSTQNSNHRTARQKTTSVSLPRRISTGVSTPYDLEALSQRESTTETETSEAMSHTAKDFYVDMLELIDSPTPASRHTAPRASSPSPSTPLPEDHPQAPTPFSIALASQVQRPSSAGPLSKSDSQAAAYSATEGASPRTSRETARRLVQNHPPPPPPPNAPPPAVPVDAEGRPVRRRASTVTSLTNGAQPTSSGKSKGRRSRTSSTSSAKNQAILPPNIPLPPNHSQRMQMLGLPNVPPLSPALSECDSRPPSWSIENRDSIASTFSAGVPSAKALGSTREDGKVVEVIIADAMAVTAAKKYY